MKNKTLMHSRFMRLSEVRYVTGLSRSSIYAYMARGEFPRSCRIGPRSIGWSANEIDEWMQKRISNPACAS